MRVKTVILSGITILAVLLATWFGDSTIRNLLTVNDALPGASLSPVGINCDSISLLNDESCFPHVDWPGFAGFVVFTALSASLVTQVVITRIQAKPKKITKT